MGYAFDNQDNRYTFSWTYRDWVIGGLARCHDHPYEPVTTAYYYALHGIFASSRVPEERPVIGEPPQGAESEAFQKKLSELMQGIADHESTELRRRKKTDHGALCRRARRPAAGDGAPRLARQSAHRPRDRQLGVDAPRRPRSYRNPWRPWPAGRACLPQRPGPRSRDRHSPRGSRTSLRGPVR